MSTVSGPNRSCKMFNHEDVFSRELKLLVPSWVCPDVNLLGWFGTATFCHEEPILYVY